MTTANKKSVVSGGKPVSDGGMRRSIGSFGLLFLSLGAIIGSGWLYACFTAAQIAGPASILSWIIGAGMIFVIGLVFAELGTMFSLSCGSQRYMHFAFGSLTSHTCSWAVWLGSASTVAIEVVATLQYAANYLPWLVTESSGNTVLSFLGFVVAAAMIAFYSILNMVAIQLFIRFNNVVVVWKLAIVITAIAAVFTASFQPNNFVSFGGFAPHGAQGILSAIAAGGIIFSFQGFRESIQFGGETSNPSRDIPIALFGSILIALILYLFLQISYIGALPAKALQSGWQNLNYENSFGPLAGLSLILGLTWLSALLYIDAVISPGNTGLIFAGDTVRSAYAAARNGTAPKSLASLNTFGVPWLSTLVTFVVCFILLLPFPSWQKLVGFSTGTGVIMTAMCSIALGALRRQLPNQPRSVYLPGGDVIPFAGFFFSNLMILWIGWTANWHLFLFIAFGYIFYFFLRQTNDATEKAIDLISGIWLFPWAVTLLLISWLAPYGHGLKLLGPYDSIVCILIFSLIFYPISLMLRLSDRRTRSEVEIQQVEGT